MRESVFLQEVLRKHEAQLQRYPVFDRIFSEVCFNKKKNVKTEESKNRT